MLYLESLVDIVDNSGARFGKIIKLYQGSRRKGALLGDEVLVSVRKVNSSKKNLKVQKGSLYRGVIVRTKKEITRKDNTTIKMSSNGIVLITAKGNPIGTRIRGPVLKELRDSRHIKIASLAEGLI